MKLRRSSGKKCGDIDVGLCYRFILAVVLALFVAPLKASPTVSNAPSDWEIISGGFLRTELNFCQHPWRFGINLFLMGVLSKQNVE
ncbi:MAG: hypothetical protein CM15mP49_35490 [Actinomycetota bacterium]|nr:MAG: hypothetical protein CM15mP49_35490 [Actinomycetota bacterium]